MSVTINAASASITVADGNANPGVAIRTDTVLFHLTQGFDGSGIAGNAFTAGGHVNVALGPGDNLNSSDFGFIQFTRANFCGFFYAGRIRKEGSVAIQCHVPPALPKAVLLDSITAITPFTRDTPRFSFVAPQVNSSTGDHPSVFVPVKFRNSGTNVTNFLFHVLDDREFWTVFTAVDPSGARRYLAHFHWQARHDVEFMWRNGNPAVRTRRSSFRVLERNVKGPPTEGDLQSLLANPVPPQFNASAETAIKLGFLGPRGANRSENPEQFLNVPADFFL